MTKAGPDSLVAPYDNHFYPPATAFLTGLEGMAVSEGHLSEPLLKTTKGRKKIIDTSFRSRRAGHPMVAFTLVPKPFGFESSGELIKDEEIDTWDFVLRNAFVQANTPIKKAISCVNTLQYPPNFPSSLIFKSL
jgi:hypothetical protein